MSKIETTSKVLLRPTSRINLRKRGARTRRVLDFGHNPQAPPLPLESLESVKHLKHQLPPPQVPHGQCPRTAPPSQEAYMHPPGSVQITNSTNNVFRDNNWTFFRENTEQLNNE